MVRPEFAADADMPGLEFGKRRPFSPDFLKPAGDGWDLADVRQTSARPVPTMLQPVTFEPVTLQPAGTDWPGYAELDGSPSPAPVGPIDDQRLTRSGHVRREYSPYKSFGQQASSSKTEIFILGGYVLAQGIPKLFKDTSSFHFHDEGWFGKDTQTIGMDKLTHAFNTYLIAELLHHRIHRNTGGAEGDAVTAGVLAAGLMALNEISDGIEPDAGYSMQDIVMNIAGAGFSVLRNTVPGLKEKLAFKIEIIPNDQVYSHVGKKHYEQERFLFSLKGSGFEKLENSPLKYLDLQVGYYASDFLNSDREQGIVPKQHLFVGIGLNLGELLFAKSRSTIGRAAYSVLDYVQLPYTSLRYDSTGRLGN